MNILILGVGAGYFEIPLLYYLRHTYPKIKLNITAIDKSQEYGYIFHAALNEIFGKGNGSFGREEFKNINENRKEQSFKNSSKKLDVQFIVKDIEQDYEVNPDFNGKDFSFTTQLEKYDIVFCSFILNHINFWRALLVGVKKCLKTNGQLFISEISGDSLLLNGDISNWKAVETNNNHSSELLSFFTKFYPNDFSILSDNSEVSAINIELADKFLSEIGFKSYKNVSILLDVFKTNTLELVNAIENEVYSCFTENVKFHNAYFGRKITEYLPIPNSKDINFSSKVKWSIYEKEKPEKSQSKLLSNEKYGITSNNLDYYKISMLNQFQWLLYQKNPLSQVIPDGLTHLRDFYHSKLRECSVFLRSHLKYCWRK